MQIAFIGLGHMGGPMALNLHKAGHQVSAFDLSNSAREKFAANGLARNLYAAHSLAGHGALDFSSVLKMVQRG